VDAASALCGSRISWNSTIDKTSEKRTGTILLVPIANPNNPHQGNLLQAGTAGLSTGHARYMLGTDEALTLITESETLHFEERIWFASPNLRLRTGLLKHGSELSLASFCSEIRMGSAKPPESAKTVAQTG
jgi:hypothetical protein